MMKPVQGSPVKMSDYFKGTAKMHLYGLLGGAIWCLGNSVSFMAVGSASPAISYGLSNSAPVVAALWGILVWKEFRDAPGSYQPAAGADVCLLPDRAVDDCVFQDWMRISGIR